MITHEEARIEAVSYNHEAIKVILKYIKQQETLQAEHEALKKDVARYFDMLENYEGYSNEFRALYEKLSKVGKEE